MRCLLLVVLISFQSARAEPVSHDFQTTRNSRSIGKLAGTAAAPFAFTEFQRGRFRFWQALHVPNGKLAAVQAAVIAQGISTTISNDDEEVNLGYLAEHVASDGSVPCTTKLPELAGALTKREKHLGADAKSTTKALATAVPSAEYRSARAKNVADIEQLARDLDAAGQRGNSSVLVFEQPIDQVACLLSTGAEQEPEPEELAAALRSWRTKYGAQLVAWNGLHGIGLSIERPPSRLSDLRDFARELQLICPATASDDLGVTSSRASRLLVLVGERRVDCEW